MTESQHLEYKRELTDQLERSVVGFLNSRDGVRILLGVGDGRGEWQALVSEKEFFEGFSVPRNKELMRIFRDLDLVEYLGSGIPRILRVYPRSCFRFTENFIRMVFPVPEIEGESAGESAGERRVKTPEKTREKTPEKTSGKTSGKILDMMRDNPEVTIPELAASLGRSTRAVEMQIRKLRDAGQVERVGSAKGGHWVVKERA